MDVRLSSEQVALRDAAAHAVTRLGPRAVVDLEDAERATKLDAAVAGAGWRELRTGSDEGRPWASAVEVAVVAEELGRGLADTSFLGPTLAADLRRLAGVPVAAGTETVLMRPDLAAPARCVDGAAEGAAVALDARGAEAALVLLPVAGGYQVGCVQLESAATEPGPGPWPSASAVVGTDLTRLVATVTDPGAVTVLEGRTRVLGHDDLARWQSLGLATTCADLVGVMRGALGLASDYARARRQFGVAIGSFQAVQHMLADAVVALEGSRSIGLHAAWAVDALSGADSLAAASAAKAYCARAARAVCEAAVQVHGGIGNTWDCLAHVFLRRALVSAEAFGGIGVSLDRVLVARGVRETDGLL